MIWFITILCITSVIFYFYFCFTLKVKNNLKEIQYLKADVNHYRSMFLCLRKKLQIDYVDQNKKLITALDVAKSAIQFRMKSDDACEMPFDEDLSWALEEIERIINE